MAIINVRGRVTPESAGAVWHLIGSVKIDKLRPNTLTLTRQVDSLSKMIRSAGGRYLPAVQITSLSGVTAKLLQARIAATLAGRSKYSTSHSTSELEDVSFTYQKIAWEHRGGKASASDDWEPG